MHEKPQNQQKYQKRQKHQKNKDATKQKRKTLQANSNVWWSHHTNNSTSIHANKN